MRSCMCMVSRKGACHDACIADEHVQLAVPAAELLGCYLYAFKVS